MIIFKLLAENCPILSKPIGLPPVLKLNPKCPGFTIKYLIFDGSDSERPLWYLLHLFTHGLKCSTALWLYPTHKMLATHLKVCAFS